MSYVDQSERPSRTFSERFQEVWDHPTPFGLIAQIKTLLSAPETIRGLVDASRVVTGPAPGTEEEADKYNRAREYLPRAAFEVASALSPTAPRAVRGPTVRPNTGSGQGVEGGLKAQAGVLGNGSHGMPQFGPRSQSHRYAYSELPATQAGPKVPTGGIFGDLVLPPTELPWWMQALAPPVAQPAGAGGPLPAGAVGRSAFMPTFPGPERLLRTPRAGGEIFGRPSSRSPLQPEPNAGGSVRPPIVGLLGLDSNHRELRRVDQNSRDASRSGTEDDRKPSLGIPSPSIVPDQEPPAREPEINTDGGGLGGKGGGLGSGRGRADRDRECNQQWQDEIRDHCPQFGRFEDQYRRQCEARAAQRLKACFRGQVEPPRFEWEDVAHQDLEGLQRWNKSQERKLKARRKKR